MCLTMKKRSPNSHASHTKEFLICFNKHGEKEEERERKRRGEEKGERKKLIVIAMLSTQLPRQ